MLLGIMINLSAGLLLLQKGEHGRLKCKLQWCFRGNPGLGQAAGFGVSRAGVSCIQELTETRAILPLPSAAPVSPFLFSLGTP